MDFHCSIKFNRSYLNRYLCRFLPNTGDPRGIIRGFELDEEEFTKYVSTICTYNIWRATQDKRHPLSDDLIYELMSKKENGVILDVGVSDGSTSLNIIERLGKGFKKFYAADRCLSLYYFQYKGATYFYDPLTKSCYMKITDRFVVYYDRKNLLLPLKWLSNLLLSRAPKYDGGAAREISLCLPRLMELAKKDSRVMILEWNMFDPWPHEKVDLIKIANVLNRSYFTNGEILAAIENLRRALKPDGRLLVVENRAVEQWSLFAMEGSSLKLVSEGNGGCDISSLVERSGSKN